MLPGWLAISDAEDWQIPFQRRSLATAVENAQRRRVDLHSQLPLDSSGISCSIPFFRCLSQGYNTLVFLYYERVLRSSLGIRLINCYAVGHAFMFLKSDSPLTV